jgi:hypothetical protein
MTDTCNPRLGIPLSDDEGHMALPEIAQAQMLANQLRMAAEMNKPRPQARKTGFVLRASDQVSPSSRKRFGTLAFSVQTKE